MAGIFRAYDIRGIYGQDLTPELALKIGLAFGNFLGGREQVVVGRDSRLSGPPLERALTAGLMASGCSCVGLGIVPTPVLYFASVHYGQRGGVMLTASHNPPQYNGFKLCRGGVAYSYETCIGKLEEAVEKASFTLASWQRVGAYEKQEVLGDYSSCVIKNLRLEKKLKIVLDIGNGACGYSEKIFRNLGCQVGRTLFPEPDGRFPNHIPDPLKEETLTALRQEVVASKADMGVAFDGDGDRVGFVDDRGRIVPGDSAFILFVRDVLKKHPASKIVLNVLCSKAVVEDILAHGGAPVTSRVGHSYIQEAFLREEAALAGEVSGHYYFGREYYGYDDGIYAALRMAEILSKSPVKFSQLVDGLPRYVSSSEIRIPCSDSIKFKVVNRLREKFQGEGYRTVTIDGVKVELEDGWGAVRASNTEPVLVFRFEASTSEKLEEIRRWMVEEAKKMATSLT
ncbi:phosphomannomutase/phosphoglucomutase [Candidatus Hecatella orcuttiae]|uniref:phosphomannomutase/phosphoglucomutase n=1 Tax=Candidatus Hecatella orcuttiae TaxID=1935119 RepID=UPI0028683971|nr:phosphomannomutase/phosphoglucomutase [Candidatus Hecatella orcuttiae]